MIALEVFGESPTIDAVAKRLHELGGVSRVRIQPLVHADHSLVSAHISHDAADLVLDQMRQMGVARRDVTLTRVEELGGGLSAEDAGSLIWADVIGLAGTNARLIGRYLVFMGVAGVIAAFGITETSAILVVGAMAISPDLLPITAMAVGLISRSGHLVARALLTLVVGLAMTAATAAVVGFAQHQLSLLPSDFSLGSTVLHGLVSVNIETVTVAFAAGIAAMLAFETRASYGVGVAISVTTIPAAAYLGVATGLGETHKALGALGVLGTNVAMIIAGAALTLALQRWLRRFSASSRDPH